MGGNPGHVWWSRLNETLKPGGTNFVFGRQMLQYADPKEKASNIHVFSYRYGNYDGSQLAEPETWMTRMTGYHTAVLIEWEHAKYSSVIELAWQFGIGGYKGRSWYNEDPVDSNMTELFRTMHEPANRALVQPWEPSMSEIRILDKRYPTAKAWEQFMKSYPRYVEPHYVASSRVKRRFARSRVDLLENLLSWITRSQSRYIKLKVDCMTFALDLFNHFAAKRDPYKQAGYRPKTKTGKIASWVMRRAHQVRHANHVGWFTA